MRIRRVLALAILFGALLGVATQGAADAARGKQLFAVCSACHTASGGGNPDMLAPSIAGLDEWYVVRQLDKFRAGWRGRHFDDPDGARMRAMAQTLDSEDSVRSVAAYVASLPPAKPAATISGGDPVRGADYYVACKACHGEGGDGNQGLDVPAINHASDWYLLKQLEHFRAGIRGSDPGDRTGRLMRGMAVTLPDDQALKDVVAYVMTLSPPRGIATAP